MRTRTFIGLILLVAALIVASTPALLQPTADGVEHLAVEAGVLPDQDKLAEERRKELEPSGRGSADVEPRLELKGYAVEDDADLRDTQAVGERDVNVRGRLEAGGTRLALPGQKPGTDALSPPFAAEDGLLLDIDGCPVLQPDADVAAILADPAMTQRYQGKISEADDPAACEVVFNERIALATATDDDGDRGATRRQLAGIEQRSLAAVGITMREFDMLASIFDFEDMPEVLGDDDAAGTSATPTATTGAAPAAPAAG